MHLCRIEACPGEVESGFAAHVVDVEFEVAAIHDGEHQAEGVLGLVGVRQRDDKARVDSPQYLLFDQYHRLAPPFLDSLFLQLFASVHFASGAHLARTHFTKSTLAQHSVHAERLVRHRLTETKINEVQNFVTHSFFFEYCRR